MNSEEMIDRLNALIKLDYNATQAYEQALDNIDVPYIHDKIDSFRTDHERHISNLSKLVRQLGGNPPELSLDIKGTLLEGFTALRSVTGMEGALKAMESNEELTNKRYGEANQLNFPMEVKKVIRDNFDDEKRHLQYIKNSINEKVWETGVKV